MFLKRCARYAVAVAVLLEGSSGETEDSNGGQTGAGHTSYKFHHDMTRIYPRNYKTVDPNTGYEHRRSSVHKQFILDVYEVSNQQFEAFVDKTGYKTEAEEFGWSFVLEQFASKQALEEATQSVAGNMNWLKVDGANWRTPDGPGSEAQPTHPVVHVSWRDAEEYCKWALGPGGRLPTEDEWELASRGGKEMRVYPWGNKFKSEKLNIWNSDKWLTPPDTDGYSTTAPIDFGGPQNDYELYNMVGNVWEMTSTPWSEDRASVDARTETEKVKRGGSYMCHENFCFQYRCHSRSHNSVDSSASNLGFRCASAYPPQNVPEYVYVHVVYPKKYKELQEGSKREQKKKHTRHDEL